MRLHANAALSWQGRQRLAERVVVEGWTLTAAAEAAGVSVRCARKWIGRDRLQGGGGLLHSPSRPRGGAHPAPGGGGPAGGPRRRAARPPPHGARARPAAA